MRSTSAWQRSDAADPTDVGGIGRERRDEGRRFDAGDLAAAVAEVVGPAGGVEPAGVVAGHALEQFDGEVVGEHAHQVRRRERRVGEVDRAEVGPLGSQQRPEQREVVVLHEHDGVLSGASSTTTSAKARL